MLNCFRKICPPLGQENIPDNVLNIYCSVSDPEPRVLHSPTWLPWAKWENGEAKLVCVYVRVSESRCLVFCVPPPPSPSCFGVPSSQMDAVRQLNDACFPSLALAAEAVYMQSRRQTSCKTHVLIYVGALRNYTNIALLTAHINAPTTCNESRFIWGELMLSISADKMQGYLILIQHSEKKWIIQERIF